VNLRGNPYIGTAGAFLGAGIVSLSQRMLSVGLPDLRGALGLGVDEAAWVPTACNMALMFMGAFSVYLGAVLGLRRVLLATGSIYAVVSLLLPYAHNLGALLALQIVAGLTSGTFYPQSMTYALRTLPARYTIYGIGAYSMELISTLSIATPLQAWFTEHWSWRWMFWISAVLTPFMMLCIYLAVPHPPPRQGPKPVVRWQGFLYASLGLALVEGALEQGERLDWLGSPVIIAMLATGGFLIVAAIVQRRIFPNPLVNLSFLARRNTLLLGFGIFSLRFTLLAVVYLIPGYLGVVQSYRPLQTGAVLLWLALPVVASGVLAARLMQSIEGRVIAGLGFATVAFACALDSRMTSGWSGENFWIPQIVVASGLSFVFVGVIGMVVQQALETGAATKPVEALTYASLFQVVRLLGGQAGTSALQHIVVVRERFHSNILGLNVDAGDWLTDERLRSLTGGVFGGSVGLEDSQARASALLSLQVSREAFTLAYSDGFLVVAWLCATFLIAIACLRPMKIYFDSPLLEPPG
jgi:DHA2 family multidrug resistance protein